MGSAMTAAGMAMAGAKMAGGAMLGGAANMVGGASAIKAAFTKAQSNMSGGDMPSFGSGSNDDAGSDNANTGDTPFSQAAGFAGSGQPAGSSSGGGFGRAASLVAGTAGELAKGAGSKVAGKFQDKVNQTAGGRLATSIRESMEPKGDTYAGADSPSPSFDSDSLGVGGTSWMNQTGGFDGLSSEEQEEARQAHAEWQESDPEKHTFDVEGYVSYAQERNEEVAGFVNRGQQAT